MDEAKLLQLLHEVDGQLGLAVHRGEGKSERWILESSELITRIRSAIREIEESS